MKRHILLVRLLLCCCLAMTGVSIPGQGQGTVTITGDINVCVGEVAAYTPSIVNAAWNYQWSVTPSPRGSILSDNSTGTTIQWNQPGGATINLVISDPLNNNQTLFTGNLNVNIQAAPAPYITSDVLLGCQPLEEPRPDTRPEFDSSHCQLVCSYSLVRYTAHGSGGSSFTWSASGALSVSPTSGGSTQVNWGAPGAGMVTLTETTAAGCTASTSFCTEIIEKPHAQFVEQPKSGDPIVICLYGSVVLLDQSTGTSNSPLESWLWLWGDGSQTTTSAGAVSNPVTHQYNHPGSYVITLVVTNSCGCTDTFLKRVEVLEPEAPKIACPRVVCEGEKTDYTIDRPCPDGYWDVEGGTIAYQDNTRVTVTWDQVDPKTGFGYVMYHSCDPCPMIVTEEIPVVLQHGDIEGPSAICPGGQYVYRMPKWPSTEFNWSVSPSNAASLQPTDQRNEIALTPSAGGPSSFTLTVNYFNTVLGCEGNAKLHITIQPQGVISGDELLCQGESRSYTVTGGYPGNWVLRNSANAIVATSSGTTFNYTFATPGDYKLSVTGSAFCPPEDLLITAVATPPPPNAILGPDRACEGIPIKYEGDNPMPGLTYLWSVSSGNTNAAIGDISYITFAGAPNYTVTLQRRTTEGAGCLSNPIQKTVMAAVPALIIAGPDTVCHSTTVSYSVNYTDGDLYEWSVIPATLGSVVNNGNTPNPDVLWNVPTGTGQTATLQVKVTKCGVPTIQTYTVYVRGIPQITSAVWSKNPECSGAPVTLTVTSNMAINSGNYLINWGDGNTSTGSFPVPPGPTSYDFTYTYNTTGAGSQIVFYPSVTITDPNGCIVKVTDTLPSITILPSPVALISPSGTLHRCMPFSETLVATETTGMAGTNSFMWSPSGSSSIISATGYGTYTVTVTNSLNNCSNTSAPVYIVPNCGGSGGGTPGPNNPPGCGTPPAVSFTVTENCGGFTITPSMTGGVWSLQGGTNPFVSYNVGAGDVVSGTATVASQYTFVYVLRNPPGSACEYYYYADVVIPYTGDVRYSISCNQAGGNYTIGLYDHSTQYPLTPITSRDYYILPSMTWVGSGILTATQQAPGTTVTYIEVIGDGGVHPSCTSSVVVTTPVFPTLTVSDQSPYNPGCIKDVVFAFAHSTTGAISSYWWNFGDGATNASDQTPIGKVYTTLPTGPTYSSTLTVKDDYGCVASDQVSVTVVDNKYENDGHGMSALPTPVCKGSPVTLTYLPGSFGPATISYTWYNQDQPLYTTIPPTNSFNVYQSGGYWVYAVGDHGCVSQTAEGLAVVDVIEVPPVSVAGNSRQCRNQAFTLRTQDYGTGYSYQWSTGATGTSMTTTLSSAGTYNYSVTITDIASGCSFTSPVFTVTVSNPPAPPSLSYSILQCQPYELQLHAAGAAGTYNWSNGMSGATIQTPHGGPYQVTLTDLNGCRVQNTIQTPRSLEEYMWIFPTGCFCTDGYEPYLIGPIIPLSYWEWLENGGVVLSGGGYVQDFHGPNPGNIYNLFLDDGNCQLMSGDMYYQTDTCDKLAQPPSMRGVNVAEANSLSVAPNPAISEVAFGFGVVSGANERSIEVIDMMGRTLKRFVLHSDSGTVTLPLGEFAAGSYRVVLRRDGVVVAQQQLVVTR